MVEDEINDVDAMRDATEYGGPHMDWISFGGPKKEYRGPPTGEKKNYPSQKQTVLIVTEYELHPNRRWWLTW